ncbi:MAG: hypothetical protein EBR82_46800 [Caulobacteraceae bacterium]|nr:hypothetical protein [Caulobacteraceae bacterium]
MAASHDWIKVEKATARKPEVLQIAAALGVHPDQSLGMCVRFWMWCDDNLSRDCRALRATNGVLDAIIGCDGFTTALVDVGWLEVTDDHIRIPNFDRHLSRSSKKRAENTRRQSDRRADVAPMSRTERDTRATKARADKEKDKEEEKDAKTPPNPLGGSDRDGPTGWAERIYAAYPRKVGKPAALRHINAAIRSGDVTPERLLELTETYAEARRGADPQFTPHASTWFSQRRWGDDPETWRPNGSDHSRFSAPAPGREQDRIERNLTALEQFALADDAGPMFAPRLCPGDSGAGGAQAHRRLDAPAD